MEERARIQKRLRTESDGVNPNHDKSSLKYQLRKINKEIARETDEDDLKRDIEFKTYLEARLKEMAGGRSRKSTKSKKSRKRKSRKA